MAISLNIKIIFITHEGNVTDSLLMNADESKRCKITVVALRLTGHCAVIICINKYELIE